MPTQVKSGARHSLGMFNTFPVSTPVASREPAASQHKEGAGRKEEQLDKTAQGLHVTILTRFRGEDNRA